MGCCKLKKARVSAHDGKTLVAAATLLFISRLAAAYLPARRAAGADPMEALRAITATFSAVASLRVCW
jgi:hypothetical protein